MSHSGKNFHFGHNSFIKVIENGTIAQTSHQVSHEVLFEAVLLLLDIRLFCSV